MPSTIVTQAAHVTSSVSNEPIFTVLPDVPLARAVEEARDLLDQAAGCLAVLAATLHGVDGEQARGTGSLIYSARAILDAIETAIERQERDQRKGDAA